MKIRYPLAIATGLLLAFARLAAVQAGDWPQILGPHRDGVAENEELTATWPEEGPAVVWKASIGAGYSGPVVKGDRVVIHHRLGDKETVDAMSTSTGKIIWRTEFPSTYRGGVDPDQGPRCTPVIAGNSVFTLSAGGELHCLSLSSGRKVWSKDLVDLYDSKEGYFGIGSTPIVIGDFVLVNAGGSDRTGIIALRTNTGALAWKTGEDDASYSSPIAATIGGEDLAVFVTRMRVVAVYPKTGKEAFHFDFGKRGPTVNAANPIVFEDRLFVTSSYGVGAQLMRVTATAAKPIWGNDETMSSQYPTPIYHDGHLYGIHGRDDIGVAELRCIDAETGKVKWAKTGFGMAHGILVGDEILWLKTDGKLLATKADPKTFTQTRSATIATGTTRAQPAIADGKYYFRTTTRNDSQLICIEVGKAR